VADIIKSLQAVDGGEGYRVVVLFFAVICHATHDAVFRGMSISFSGAPQGACLIPSVIGEGRNGCEFVSHHDLVAHRKRPNGVMRLKRKQLALEDRTKRI
jgi:hypothetical protein